MTFSGRGPNEFLAAAGDDELNVETGAHASTKHWKRFVFVFCKVPSEE